MVKVYSKEQSFCGQCKTTKRDLDNKGVEYEVIDVESDAEAFEYVKSLGYQQVPVTVTPSGEHWTGFQPDKNAELALQIQV